MIPLYCLPRRPGVSPEAPARRRYGAASLLALVLLAGCSALLPAVPEPPALFSLDQAAVGVPVQPPPVPGAAARSTLLIGAPRAAAGFDSSRMVYIRQPHQLETFAYNQWVDPPAQMLWPLIAKAIESSGAFKAVVVSPSGASADWRLDIELLRLQQEFTALPSSVRVTLRAHLIDSARRSVVASRTIEAVEPAPTDDPYGGVVAANQAVARAVGELAAFAAEVATAPGNSGTGGDPRAAGTSASKVPETRPSTRSAAQPASPRAGTEPSSRNSR